MQRFRDLRVRAEGGGAMTTENEFGRTEPSVAEELLMLAQAIAKVIIRRNMKIVRNVIMACIFP